MDFRTITEQGRHGVRVTAIILREASLLTYKVDDQYHLVGGAIHVGESTYEALLREVKEELGLTCNVKDLMFVVENRFDYKGEQHHMIEFHYGVELLGDPPLQVLDNGKSYTCVWLPLNKLETFDLKPSFLKKELAKWSGHMQHMDISL